MIRNGVDWSKVYVDATRDPAVHGAVLSLLVKKTGVDIEDGEDASSVYHPFKVISGAGRIWGFPECNSWAVCGRNILSISELAALPDYQPTKKMTVPEICEALGYDVEIVKGGE